MDNVENAGETHFAYSFPRVEGQEIKFAIREYRKKLYLDFRLWFHPENTPEGELRPSRKGFWLRIDQLQDLEKGMSELIEAASRIKPPAKQPWRGSSSSGSGQAKPWSRTRPLQA